MEGTIHRRIETQIPAAQLLVDDRANLPGPSIGGVRTALIADLGREAHVYRPMPFFRNAHPRPDMIAYPLIALARAIAHEDVETGLEPTVEALSNLDGFVQGVVIGPNAVNYALRSFKGEVRVQLHHGAAWRHRLGAVHLHL